MAQFITPPDARGLLPPLLACLPTAFASSRPPPALLPLLSPILRQRVQLLSANSTAQSGSWLRLLSWDHGRAAKLPSVIEGIQLEPHPVSGEVDIPDPDSIHFRRLDHETLHTRFELGEFGLLPIYLWCEGDEKGWRLAELRSLEDIEDGTQWFDSITEADETSKGHSRNGFINGMSGINSARGHLQASQQQQPAEEDDDDDDYWAMYDRTPGRTPAQKRSPAPNHNSSVQLPTTDELEYFARYAAEVQPAMDSHDPDEEGTSPGESTLNGNALSPGSQDGQMRDVGISGTSADYPAPLAVQPIDGRHDSLEGVDGPKEDTSTVSCINGITRDRSISQPRPESPASSASVERLESSAHAQSQAEVAIKQHISTDLKSLYRLARASGIQRDEFERVVRTELELLSLMELDDD